MPIKVAIMGLGAIGRGVARCALQKGELELVAAVDLDPSRVGKSSPTSSTRRPQT